MSKWFCTGDGKKTVTGAIVLALPSVVQAVAGALGTAGLPDQAAVIIQIVGAVTLVAGLIHKLLKKLDPAGWSCF